MLQYKTQPQDRFSVVEQCQMVIEGGCSWIQLSVKGIDENELRDIVAELILLCKETQTILVIEDSPELVRETGASGLHITLDSGLDAVAIRQEYGPEAIIGVEVDNAEAIVALQTADIDYVTLPSNLMSATKTAICAEAATRGNVLPIVFEGDYKVTDTELVLLSGASGICTGKHIINAPDPVEYTHAWVTKLNSTKTS